MTTFATLAEIEAPKEFSVFTSESIAYQHNDSFGPKLEAITMEFMDLANNGATAKDIEAQGELKAKYQKLIYDRFGITVALICDRQLAACMPNVYTEHNGMVRDAMRSLLKDYGTYLGISELRVRPSGGSIGTVNTETAKITGWMSEQVVPLFMNFQELTTKYKLNSAQQVAIALHELGHIFMSAAKAYTVSKANFVIGDIVKYVSNKDRGGDINYIYQEFAKLDPNVSKETIEGLHSDNVTVFGISAFRATIGVVRSMSGSNSYDNTTNEAMADSFAVRMGYAEPLATGLDAILNDPSRKLAMAAITVFNTYVFYLVCMSLFSMFKALTAGVLAVKSLGFIYNLVISVVGMYTLVKTNRHSTMDYEYDLDDDRIRRAKQNVIGQLKDPSLSKETKKAIIEQIKVISDIEDKTFSLPRPITMILMPLFSSDIRSYRSVAAQQKIEEMLSNRLFVAAAKLDTKA